MLGACRVLDLSGELGWLCGRILADLGADVIKVEPPGGEPGRHRPPLVEGQPGRGASLPWLAFNANKRGITLDVHQPSGRKLFLQLAETADFVIETFPPGRLDALALGWRQLQAANPRLILTSITPYGQEGPAAHAPASDLELMAAAGAVWLAGDADRPPVRISQPQAALWASTHAAMGTLIAHHFRERTGRGQHVDAAGQAGVVWALSHAPVFWDLLGEDPQRAGPYLTGRNLQGVAMRNIWPCKDGFVTFALYGSSTGRHSNRQLTEWMASRGMAPEAMRQRDWDQFDVVTVTQEEIQQLEEAIGAFFLTLSKKEFFEGAVARRMLGYPVGTASDIAEDPQLKARAAWQDVLDPTVERPVRYPGGFARFDGSAPRIRRPAPGVGEHNREVFGELGLQAQDLAPLTGAGVL
jgi:crotonobetainyl-CoA:carnitine CoA-transferase CaiB-like acyl-CoA transferase